MGFGSSTISIVSELWELERVADITIQQPWLFICTPRCLLRALVWRYGRLPVHNRLGVRRECLVVVDNTARVAVSEGFKLLQGGIVSGDELFVGRRIFGLKPPRSLRHRPKSGTASFAASIRCLFILRVGSWCSGFRHGSVRLRFRRSLSRGLFEGSERRARLAVDRSPAQSTSVSATEWLVLCSGRRIEEAILSRVLHVVYVPATISVVHGALCVALLLLCSVRAIVGKMIGGSSNWTSVWHGTRCRTRLASSNNS